MDHGYFLNVETAHALLAMNAVVLTACRLLNVGEYDGLCCVEEGALGVLFTFLATRYPAT